jgi:hypothetical protein
MFARETVGAVSLFGGDTTQLDNQKKISDFEHKLQHAKDLYAKQYPPSQNEKLMPLDWNNPEEVKAYEISEDITLAEGDLDYLKNQYARIEDTRDDPSGYDEYVTSQQRFDDTAEHFEKYANEALEDLRDPQTFGGDVREVGRDIKDAGSNFWDWIRG